MRRVALSLCTAFLTGSCTNPGAPASPCGTHDRQTYQRKADLPRGVVEATGVVMAEKGEAYQRGDVMIRGLPLYRFVRATRSGCRITIRYEQGGFSHRWGSFSLHRVMGSWRFVRQD